MEHRESPRIVSAEGRPRDARVEPGADGHRFARFVTSPAERRLVFSRLGLAVMACVLALVLVGVVGSQVFGKLVRWLHDRPEYQTRFAAITLEPAPPAWYRGGATVFLDRVREEAQREDVPFSALDLDLDKLSREFRLYFWVKRVHLVEHKWPNRIIVHLEYRRPVARTDLPGGNLRVLLDDVLLDEDGVILPLKDVEEEKALRLVYLKGLDPPFEPRTGHVWMSDEASQGLGKASERVLAAARLAAFLDSALEREAKSIWPALRPVVIHSCEAKNAFFIQNSRNTMIYWLEPQGLETPRRRAAQQRWNELKDWFQRHPDTPVLRPSYLEFTKDGVVIRHEKASAG